MEDSNEVKYAGFFTRLLVVFVDIFVVSLLVYMISMVVSIEKNPIIVLLIWWLYTAIMLNRWQTTIGGKVLGIKILDSNLARLSFLKASIRLFISIAPFMLYTYLRGLQHTMTLPPSPTVQMLPQLIFILLPFIMYFSKKRQMIHDMVVKSIVIDVNTKIKETDTMGKRIVPIGQKVLRVVGSVLFLIVFGYVAMYTYVFYTLGKQSTNSHNASFHTEYHPKDYNNSKIIFYKKEIEEASKDFIEAEEMYDIFKADVKKDLALGCIRYFIKREGSENWLDEGTTHRVSARNKYANTEDKIEKEKINSSYMGKHFYTFDLNIVNHVVDDVTKVWSDKNESICENEVSANELYEVFIRKYIPRFDNENIHSQFGSKPQERELKWYKILKEKRHDIFQKNLAEKEKALQLEKVFYDKWLAEKKAKKAKREKRKLEKKLHDKLLKKKIRQQKIMNGREKVYKSDIKRGVPPIFAAIQNKLYKKLTELLDNGVDIEMKHKGVVPLMFSVYQNDDKLVKILLDYGANPNLLNKRGFYSPLSEACVTNRVSTANLLIQYGADVNYQYNKSETALTVAAKECKNFELVKLLLDNGAYPELIDRFGHNTLTGLRRYCRDDIAYEKMKKFIEENRLK